MHCQSLSWELLNAFSPELCDIAHGTSELFTDSEEHLKSFLARAYDFFQRKWDRACGSVFNVKRDLEMKSQLA